MPKLYGKIYLTIFLTTLSILSWTTFSLAVALETDKEYIDIYPNQYENNSVSSIAWVLGTTVVLYQNDQEIKSFFQKNQSRTGNNISDFVEGFGDNNKLFPSLGLLYLYGKVRDNEKTQHLAVLSLESVLLSTLITNTIKFSTHRSRPYTGESFDSWGEPSFDNDNDYLSFPSGHATSAFSVATIIASEYKEKPFVKILSYSIASLTAISRVYDNKHWASDIFLGSVIGYYSGKTVIRLNEQNNNISIIPALREQGYGLAIKYRF